jgi:aryl-alcohol dehydrogenase-like predicted oxidoreductase
MDTMNLGRTGCLVSRLCLGTMNFGWRTGEPESRVIMETALDLGLFFWDTADVYGFENRKGETERLLGRWFKDHPARRDEIVLATKYQSRMGDGANDRGASAYHIRAACEASLLRLQTDRIDLYQMHHVNRDCPWEEVYEALDTLVQQGKIIYAGVSNHAGWHIAAACEAARRLNVLGIVSEQSKYSLLCRHIELEVLPACRHYGVGVLPWSPLGAGLLGGVLINDGVRRRNDLARRQIEQRRDQFQAWEDFCRERGEPPADVALAWMLQVPGITAPIIGPRTPDQLTGSLRALEISLDATALARLDEIWPPVGLPEIQQSSSDPRRYEAPEAYAW